MARVWKPSPEDLDKLNRKARRDGIFAGATGGLVAAIYGERVLRFDRRKALATGLVAGALSGYFFSQAFFKTYLNQFEHDSFRRSQVPNMNGSDNPQGGSSSGDSQPPSQQASK